MQVTPRCAALTRVKRRKMLRRSEFAGGTGRARLGYDYTVQP